jgi:hypothetical protein
MKHVVVVAILALVRVGHADCTDPAKARAALAKADKDNAARFDAALKKTKLQPIQLRPTGGGKNRGDDEPMATPSPRARGGTVALKNGDRMIPLVYPEKTCGGPEKAEFVSDGKEVFMVQRTPKPGKSMKLEVCSCDGSPPGCGAVPQNTAIGYVLPKGMSYGGVKELDYVADVVNVRYSTPQNQPCPQAP